MLLSETLRRFYSASGFPQETSPAAEAAITSCSDAISSVAKVGDGESGRVGPKEGEDALVALEGLFEKSTWMGGYSVAVLKLITKLRISPGIHLQGNAVHILGLQQIDVDEETPRSTRLNVDSHF